MWTVDRDMNSVNIMPLDTLIDDWRIDYPYYRDGVGDMSLGRPGSSTLPFNYFDRRQGPDFKFARSYDAYTYRMDNVPFYNTKTPYLNLTYLESGAETLPRGALRDNHRTQHIAHDGLQRELQGARHKGPVRVAAYDRPQPLGGLLAHGQTLFGACGVHKQPHTPARERWCGGHVGRRRHGIRAPGRACR